MKREKIDSTLERQFLSSLVRNRPFLIGAAALLDPELFPASHARRVAQWAVDYFQKYKEPASEALRSLCGAWVQTEHPEEGDRQAVEDFVEVILDQPPMSESSAAHLLDELANYLTDRKIDLHIEAVQAARVNGRREEALTVINEFKSVTLNETAGYSPAKKKEVWLETFSQVPKGIISWPFGSEWFFDQAFTRSSLIGIQGPEKTGKTFWCVDICYWAARSHLNVAFFQVGDLSKQELNLRWGVRIAKTPLWQQECGGTLRPPSKLNLYKNTDGTMRPDVERGPALRFASPLNADIAYRAQKRFNRTCLIDKDRPTLMFSVHQNSSINVSGIDNILMRWREELNYVPDVLLIDYADILAPEDFRKESRDQVNDTWKALRRLSQKWNCCTVVPTQANAATYKQKGVQGKENFSNDKRKLAHVTAMMGLNQTDKEKEEGIMRLNWIALRGAPFNAKRCLWVATCFPLGVALGPVAS